MRRTKEEAAETRRRVLRAARTVFARQGVARTSLEQVAAEAGVTRGAVYWHFRNKADLFYQMREEFSLPLVDRLDLALASVDGSDPLADVERMLATLVAAIDGDAAARTVFSIVNFRCEYVEEFARELRLQGRRTGRFVAQLLRAYRRAARARLLRPGLRPEIAALQTSAFTIGLVRLVLVERQWRLLRGRARDLVAAHVAALRAA